MKKRIVSILLCMVLLCTIFSGCGSDEPVRLPIEKTPSSLDPQIATTADDMTLVNNCYEGLVRMDQEGNLHPGVATKWTVSEDGLTYTFTLRQSATWHVTDKMKKELEDSLDVIPTKVTAQDFVFALQRAIDPNTKSPAASSLWNIQGAEDIYAGTADPETLGVTANGDDELTIQLAYPDANLLSTLASSIGMPCNRSFFEATNGRYGMEPNFTLCNGPYYYSALSAANGYIDLSQSNTYSGPCKTGADKVRFILSQDLGTYTPAKDDIEVNASGAVDTLSSFLSKKGLDGAVLKEKDTKYIPKKNTVTTHENAVKTFLFNLNSTLTRNQNMRLALVHATKADLLFGSGSKAVGLVPNSAGLVAGQSFRKVGGPQTIPSFDLKKAASYFEKGMKTLEDNAAKKKADLDPTIFHLKLACLKDDENNMKQIIQNWQKIFGVKLSVTIASYDTQTALDAAIAADKYDIAYTSLYTDSIATNFLGRFVSTSPNNVIHLNNPIYDDYIRTVLHCASGEEMAPYLKNVERSLIENGYLLPVCFETTYLVYDHNISALSLQPSGTVYSVFTIAD